MLSILCCISKIFSYEEVKAISICDELYVKATGMGSLWLVLLDRSVKDKCEAVG